ncbi:Lrp/AsnC family transcriptional regulator [Natranaerobius trueperi]|uniref:siroheme decarboxylase n=1 Tax=Natranaerobius trueperi TaxID=759412 RepID=A0A226C126_9FIRM|nr:Lrp/AsnC family transcriptional regulator [Natranaerobius trueperi]OWZ84087.1 AsnC family protein [Natranaerobius trueperi]
MNNELTDLQKQIIAHLQGDLPMSKEPYKEISDKLGISQERLFDEISFMKQQGLLRRIGAILKHRHAGFNANAMVAWKVPDHLVNEVGKTFACFKEASHVYLRPTYPEWPYNLYTMIHGYSKEECEEIVRQMSKKTNLTEYQLLYSTKEYKKSSMTYF